MSDKRKAGAQAPAWSLVKLDKGGLTFEEGLAELRRWADMDRSPDPAIRAAGERALMRVVLKVRAYEIRPQIESQRASYSAARPRPGRLDKLRQKMINALRPFRREDNSLKEALDGMCNGRTAGLRVVFLEDQLKYRVEDENALDEDGVRQWGMKALESMWKAAT